MDVIYDAVSRPGLNEVSVQFAGVVLLAGVEREQTCFG